MTKEKKGVAIKYGLLICLFIMASISVIKGISNGLDGQRIDFLHKEFQEILFNHDGSYIVQFPSTMLFLYPLGFLSYRTAQIIWLCMQFVFSAIIIIFTKKVFLQSWNKLDYMLLILMMLAGAPWRTNLSNLQYTLCSFAFFELGLWLIQEKHEVWAGVAFSMSFFKVQLIVPLLAVLIYKKKWKPFLTLIITQFVAFGFSLYWFRDFYVLTLAKLDGIAAFNDGASGFIDFSVIFDNKVAQYIVTFLVVIAILYVSCKLRKIKCFNEGKKYLLYFSWLLLCTLVLCYHRIYDYFMFIIPVAYLIDDWNEKKNKWTGILLFCSLIAIICMNLGVTINERIAILVLRFFYYILLIGFSIKVFKMSKKV